MGWFGKLIGTDQALETGAKIIDKAFFTSEERAENATKVLFKLQDQFTPRAISRRILAFMFSLSFCGAFMLSLVYACLDKTHVVNNIIGIAKAYHMGMIMMTIIMFYFGTYLADKFKK